MKGWRRNCISARTICASSLIRLIFRYIANPESGLKMVRVGYKRMYKYHRHQSLGIVKPALFLVSLALWSAMVLMTVVAQEQQRHDARYYFQVARKAYQEKDYAALVDNMKLALALRPTHQTYMYY